MTVNTATPMTTPIDKIPINNSNSQILENVGDMQDPIVKEVLDNMQKQPHPPVQQQAQQQVQYQDPVYNQYPTQPVYQNNLPPEPSKKSEGFVDQNLVILCIGLVLVVVTVQSNILDGIFSNLNNDFITNNEYYIRYVLMFIAFYLLQKYK